MKKERIVWLVDPFGTKFDYIASAAEYLNRTTSGEVIPVYLLNTGTSVPVEDHRFLISEKKLEDATLRALHAVLAKLNVVGFKGLKEPKILINATESLRGGVEQVSRYARRVGATTLVSLTHARRGLPRFFMGSFTETLILHSRIPVLTLPPRGTFPAKQRRVLFPTSLNPKEKALFQNWIKRLKKQKGAQIVLFHHMTHFAEPLLAAGAAWMGGVYLPPINQYLVDEAKRKNELAQEWVKAAKRAGVPCSGIVSTQRKPISDAILSAAKSEKADLIALSSHQGAVGAALVGSISRQVIRNSPLPVWVKHV